MTYVPTTLITGGAGFLGSHICDRLIAEGHRVLCLDSLLTGSMTNVTHLLEHPRFIFVKHDVTTPINLHELLDPRASVDQIDYVFHFASPASPKQYAMYPIHTLKVGSLGTHHALGLAKAYGATFLLASSSEVYGDPAVHPQPESYWGNVNPIGPRSVYDEAKRFAEATAMAYYREHSLDVRIARIFNTYGPRMQIDDGRALPNFMDQALWNQPITIYGDGAQTRSFCYVDDLVEGLYRLATYNLTPPTIVNLGNPDEVTISQLVREIIETTGSASQITFEPLPEDDPSMRQPDIAHARRLLGWEPQVSRLEGIKRVIPYFRQSVREIGKSGVASD